MSSRQSAPCSKAPSIIQTCIIMQDKQSASLSIHVLSRAEVREGADLNVGQ